jgi:hypothetical protein
MQYELVKAPIPYRQVFKYPPPKRRLWSAWFAEEMDLEIEIVDPKDAPVAYVVRFGAGASPRPLGYPIRSYQDGLWWPIGGDYNYILHPESFATVLQDGHPETLVLLDASFAGCIEQRPLRPFPDEWRRVEHDRNNLENQRAVAQRGASTTIFCGDGAFVRGGEPVFYALPQTHDGDKTLGLAVGLSDPKRETDGTSRSGPGPTRSARKSAAGRGLAFGIVEVDDAVRALETRGYTVRRDYGIDVITKLHRPETAPLMCARELARHLFVESEKNEARSAHLRAEFAIVGLATSENADDDLCVEALRQVCASKDPRVAFNFRNEIRAAKSILERVGNCRLSPEDDAAIGDLGPG